MAFPTTSVLDDFNRSNGAIGSNWTDKVYGSEPNTLTVASNAVSTSASDTASGWWNVAQFGPDSEAYYKATVIDADQRLYTNLQAPGSGTVDGYETRFSETVVRVFRIDNGAVTELGSSTSYSPTNGDSFGIENIGGTITPYHKTGGSWSALTSRSDATYGTGFIGLFNLEGAPFCVQDDFGGGTVVPPAAAAAPTLRVVSSGMRW